MTIHDYLEAAQGALHTKIPASVVRQLVSTIPEEKLLELPVQQLIQILPVIHGLAPDQPFGIIAGQSFGKNELQSEQDEELISTSVILVAFDYPGLFSTIAGLLSAAEYQTQGGTIITTHKLPGVDRRGVVDVFSGFLPASLDWDLWIRDFTEKLATVFKLYEDNSDPSGKSGRIKQFVIEEVASALSFSDIQPGQILAPMSIHYEILPQGRTRFEIASSDTPFFLYSLSTALALHNVSIESIEIQTLDDRVLDILEVTDQKGKAIEDEQTLNRIKLSILLSKQFTYFVDRAPNPLQALERFDALIQDIGEVKSSQDIQQFLASAEFQQELARVLGTSDFLWEDFIRIQHENILPMIKTLGEHQMLSTPSDDLEQKLIETLEEADKKSIIPGATDPLEILQRRISSQVQALNDFKNRESFLIDMDHILVKDQDFFFLSLRLTALAEAVVRVAMKLAQDELSPRHGVPRTAAGLEAEWAVFGLGKLGGRALGYASDIELLFVFSDNGSTDGPARLTNRDYFEKLFRSAANKITARREGIFKVDLRLRPHGEDGPVAVKLQSFIDYFSRDGQAHSAERLALVRLRWIGGSELLGQQVKKIRDRIIYEEDSIKIPELRALRKRQLDEKSKTKGKKNLQWILQQPSLPGTTQSPNSGINAKFSPGTLVDLEYNVQILQIIHGRQHPELRVPGIHKALRQLSKIGTIDPEEAQAMVKAYQFFRTLINGLRMLRGNAQDLFLPSEHDLEYRYLARRIGYVRSSQRTEAEQLRIDFENHSARVRQFVERHLGRDAIPVAAAGSVVDLIYSESLSDELLARVMAQGRFKNPRRALVNLKSLASTGERLTIFAQLIVLAWDILSSSPDPDMALNNWEQFVRRIEHPIEHFNQLLGQPKRISLLLTLFGASQFLSDTLVQNPGFFTWITDPKIVGKARDQISMEQDLRDEAKSSHNRLDWLNRLRKFRKREILRIGLRDIGLGVRLEEIMGEISFLARACCEVALEEVWKRIPSPSQFQIHRGPESQRLVVCGFGKLGSWELNYSSDIDLVAFYEPWDSTRTEEEEQTYTKVIRSLVQDLTDFTQEGQAYRVDLRLRPYGASGPLVTTLSSIVEYYDKTAELWEIQALIKLKPIAGNLSIGEIFLDRVRDRFIQRWDSQTVRSNIGRMRELAVKEHTAGLNGIMDVKNSPGGIRDIEFRVQGLQLIQCRKNPGLLKGNTIKSLGLLREYGIITKEDWVQTSQDYSFLRKIEHYLQLAEDRQLHTLPDSQDERFKLAQFLFHTLKEYGVHTPGNIEQDFYRILEMVTSRVRTRYEEFLAGPGTFSRQIFHEP